LEHKSVDPKQSPSTEPRPGRVVVVRDESLRDRVDRAVAVVNGPASVARVPSFLAAMGDLAHRRADAVVGPLDAVTGMLESTGGALRELAPDARLIVTVEAGDREGAQAALRAGFDAVLIEPYDTNELAKALHLKQGGFAPRPTEEADTAEPTEPARPRAQPHAPRESDRPAPAPAAPLADGAALGDADLIDALLGEGADLRATLGALIGAQAGIEGVAMLAPGDDTPADHACVVVRYGDRALGKLTAPPPATEHDLKPWGAWASRWLAMQDRLAQLHDMALRDELTGVWNRRYFNRFLRRIIDRAHEERQQVTLLVFDIDDFKSYNDRFGHAAGDEILLETARLMNAVVREHDVVARIGGAEFAVIFWDAEEPRQQGSKHPQDVMNCARRFQKAICAHRFPKLLEDAHGTLTISGGLASYPWDGSTADDLLERADRMAMQSKQQGKNAITFGPGAARVCEPDLG